METKLKERVRVCVNRILNVAFRKIIYDYNLDRRFRIGSPIEVPVYVCVCVQVHNF